LIAQSRRKTDKVDAKILCELLRLGGLPEPVDAAGGGRRVRFFDSRKKFGYHKREDRGSLFSLFSFSWRATDGH
jgi:hypothetical protein